MAYFGFMKLNSMEARKQAFERLLVIMDELREQCPWDKKQTIESIRHLTLEESFELSDAILSGNPDEIRKELGDLMLHIVFYSRMASEKDYFDIADVMNGLCDKLIHRHPHIYGEVKVDNEEQVKENWEKLKLKEGNKSVLGGVPQSLPALLKASRIQDKAASVGFDWEKPEQVWEKVKEELAEFEAEVRKKDTEKMESEFGDLLFAMVNYARFIKVNPDDALEKTNRKFIRRFQYLEECVKAEGKNLDQMSLTEMDHYWNEAKAKGL